MLQPEHALTAFVDTCQNSSDTEAMVFGNCILTYTQLASRVVAIASLLESQGVTAGSLVAVNIERSEKLLPLLLGIWCAGAGYLPLDPAYPADRKLYMLSNAGTIVVVADSPATFDLESDDQHVLYLADHWSTIADAGISAPDWSLWRPKWQSDSVAYTIYTSGSTGLPKGIAVSHANVSNFLLGMQERPGLSSTDSLLATTTISFDIHVLELFLPLLVGATVHIVARHIAVSGSRLRHYINTHNITVLQATPTTWRMLLDDDWQPDKPLKMLVGGEPFPADIVQPMLNASCELWNMYGPTETTVWSTCYRITDNKLPISIGTPIRNTQLYVVDDDLQLVASGEIGELLIGGEGVTLGYNNQPEKNRISFIASPFARDDAKEMLYRTGDLAKQLDDGNMVYVQRKDEQFKVRGYRVEAGEIEECLLNVDGVKRAVVTVNELRPGDQRLVAHLIADVGTVLDVKLLRDHCKQSLPHYMLPQHFNQLDVLPQTNNGKVDRKLLSSLKQFSCSQSNASPHFETARHDLDLSILEVWRQKLSLDDVSIDDNFVELGGNSMLAVQLTREMRRVTGIHFEPDTLFRFRTVRELVDSIGEDKVIEAASVMQLNTVTDGVPIFCLSGVQIYQDIADHFGDSHPIYAIYAREELAVADNQQNGISLPVNNLTKAYVDAIKRQRPVGPYILSGLSFGGMLAVDVARLLVQAGDEVHLVVMFDSHLPHAAKRNIKGLFKHSMAYVCKKLIALKCVFLSQPPVDSYAPTKYDTNDFRMQAYTEAAQRFESASVDYHGKVLLIKADQTNFGFGVDPGTFYGWDAVLGDNLVVENVDAGHISMMHKPSVESVVSIMKQYIKI